jgi:uncharacterized Tic20 family protein
MGLISAEKSVATSSPVGLEPMQDERTMASLAHGLSILGFLAPLVIFLLKRQSRFVSFHALQALLWHLTYMILIVLGMVAFFTIVILTLVLHPPAKGAAPPIGLFLFFPLFWLFFMAGSIVNLILAIVYAVKAGQGEWADYPVFGRLARRFLKMGPVGAGNF